MKAKIETERLILRNFTMDDATSMYETYCTKEIVTRYLTWYPHKSLQQTVNYLKNVIIPNIDKPNLIDFAITLQNDDQVIGNISTVSTIGEEVEVGYVLDNAYWNQGYMSEALEAMIDFLFTNTKVERITACHRLENLVSGRVMRKCDMRYTGIIHRKCKMDASDTDTVRCREYEMTREEWIEKNKISF